MSKSAVFTMKLEQDLRDEFIAAAQAEHRPASQVARELMREYITRQRDEREYQAFLAGKVGAARASLRAGHGKTNDDVETEFARRRAAGQ